MNDETYTDPVEKENLLAELFAFNSQLPASTQPLPALERVSVTMSSIFFRARAVKRVLANLNVNKSSRPDSIPALLLKQCSLTLTRPLPKLFCLPYRIGIFPSCSKLADTTPIPKKDEANNHENYLAIAACSAFSKVMGSMINHDLVRYLERFAK